jgi:hypothetical protein
MSAENVRLQCNPVHSHRTRSSTQQRWHGGALIMIFPTDLYFMNSRNSLIIFIVLSLHFAVQAMQLYSRISYYEFVFHRLVQVLMSTINRLWYRLSLQIVMAILFRFPRRLGLGDPRSAVPIQNPECPHRAFGGNARCKLPPMPLVTKLLASCLHRILHLLRHG